ncbi:hypothetical protein ACROYT_G030243 [Oculina patagonica]
MEFPGSYFFYGERLINHVIRTIKVLDQDSCEFQCYLEHNCVSINFEFTGSRNCDLNNSTHKEHDKDLEKRNGYVYHGTNNACGEAPCKNNATCQSGFTSKRYRCLCFSGFTGENCEDDINECVQNTHNCSQNALCENNEGSFNCTCKPGFTGNGHDCTDTNECVQNSHNCSQNALCENNEGSFNCTCKPGFTGNGHDCTAVDFCTNQSPCQNGGVCESTVDGYLCKCGFGFAGANCENNFALNSTILSKNESYLSHLHRFIAPVVGNDSQWLLCYRAFMHGWDASTFHSQCDEKKNSVTIIEKGNYVFGGYTDIPWVPCALGAKTKDRQGRCCVFPFTYGGTTYHACTNADYGQTLWCSFDTNYSGDWDDCDSSPYVEYRSTTKAFIFSLQNKEGLEPFKAMVKDPSHAVYTAPSYGPTFGVGHDIHIASNANGNYHSYTNFGGSYSVPDGVKDEQTILAGTRHFLLDEVEVFYLI